LLAALALAVMGLAGCATWPLAGSSPDNQSKNTTSAPGGEAAAGGTERDLWHDPAFLKAFVGSYGINPQIEPRFTPEEGELLEKVAPLMADHLPEAKAVLQKEITPESSAILDLTLGNICFRQDQIDQALVYCLAAVKKFPSFRRAWRNLGLIYVSKSKYDEAITAFTKMIELGGGDAYSYGLLGVAYAAKEDYQAAEVAYRNALLLQPQNTEWRLGLTRCVFKQEKYEDATTLLGGLIERYPDKADFWLLQAQTYIGMKKPLKAAVNLEAVDRLGKSTPETLNSLGDIYLSEDLPDSAVHAYCRAIDIAPDQPVAKPLRAAEVLASRGALPQARQVAAHIREVLEARLEPADQRRLLKLEARISMADGGGNAETAKVLEEIVKLDPLDGEALMLLGQHYSRENQPDRAIFWYERAEGIDSFEANAKLRHAQALVGLHRYTEAVALIRRVHEIKPRDEVARYLEQVDRAAKAQEQAERAAKAKEEAEEAAKAKAKAKEAAERAATTKPS
jgi:tetratricopeptide (TPR) repeat protein